LKRISLTVATSDNDRTRAIIDGRVGIEGCDVTYIVMEPAEIFFRAFRNADWDVAELSFSSYMRTVDAGNAAYVAIPAFVSRVFRHSAIYIRTDRGIRTPADLRGRVIGVPEYQMTAAVWVRAMLEEDYGVRASDIRWRTGGQEEPGRGERTPLSDIGGIEMQQIADGKTLSGMLEDGEIDGLLAARPPSCFLRGARNVGRLFGDYKAVEQAYFQRTRMFPIMHLIGVRRALVQQYPWLAMSVYKAFLQAKAIAMRKLTDLTVLTAALPWIEVEARQTREVMGTDFWRYGVSESRHEIEALARYSHQQGLISRILQAEELFAASTLEISKT
jgi:4,5-dihydroxyphthalate decarboxylase